MFDKTAQDEDSVLQKILRIIFTMMCLILVLYQICVSNYFFGFHLSLSWLVWIIADILVMILFIFSFYVSFRSSSFKHISFLKIQQGELPLGYISWFFYSLLLSTKFGILYGPNLGILNVLTRYEAFGEGFIQTTLALSSLVFLFLVFVHHDASPDSSRSSYMNEICGIVCIDILDSINFLQILFVADSLILIGLKMHYAIVVCSFLNFIFPTILLISLSKSDFGGKKILTKIECAYKIVYLIMINLPMLVLRSIINHQTDSFRSIFIIKNIVALFLAVKRIMDYFVLRSHKLTKPQEFHLQETL